MEESSWHSKCWKFEVFDSLARRPRKHEVK